MMTEKLVERLIKEDAEFRRAYRAHKEYERLVERMEEKRYLSPEEEVEKKRLKKLKLAMKDKMESIILKHR